MSYNLLFPSVQKTTIHLIKEIFVSFESSKESCMSLECFEM